MSRSSWGKRRALAGTRGAGDEGFAGLRGCWSALATVPPGDEISEDHVQAAEAGGEKPVGPLRRRDHCESAGGHKAESHDRDHRHGIEAAGDDASAVEKKPGGGERGGHTAAGKKESEESGSNGRRKQAERHFATGPGEERQAAAIGLHADGDKRDEDCEDGFGEPDFEPSRRIGLTGGEPGGDEGGGAENHLSPAGNRGEGGGALHGIADEAEVSSGIGCVTAERNVGDKAGWTMGPAKTMLAGIRHGWNR